MHRVSSTGSDLQDLTSTESGQKIYNVSRSRLLGLINWVHVFGTYLPIAWFIVMGVLICQVTTVLYELRFDLTKFWLNEVNSLTFERPVAFDLGWKTMAIFALGIWYLNNREKPVYLIDFSTFEPPDSWKLSPEQLLDIMKKQGTYTDESIEFQEKILKRSGCGPATAWPPSIVQCLTTGKPQDVTVQAAREESEIVIFDCVRQVLESTNTKPKDVDILVINCSLFSPTPSLCSMVINEFNMRSDIASYNLSGMGCSAGVISIELARSLLASRPNSTALVVSTENLTQNLYRGNEKSFLLQNTLFRCGGAAIILSNKWMDGLRSHFKLLTAVRTQYVTEDSFKCVYEEEDANRQRGVKLSKEIVKVAGRAMEKNFTTLGPQVLPVSEQVKTGFWMLINFLSKKLNKMGIKMKRYDPYVPDFKRGIDHFCIHAGGRAVIDGIEKNLKLTPEHAEASRHALNKYGNTSSSSIWYEMMYIKENSNLRRGHRILQVAFGSGFKCNSCVWLCIKTPSNNKKSLGSTSQKDKDA